MFNEFSIQLFNEFSIKESDYFVNQSKHYSIANKWFGKIISLSREWDMNLDKIRRKYVYELYFHGCDPLAEEVSTFYLL